LGATNGGKGKKKKGDNLTENELSFLREGGKKKTW